MKNPAAAAFALLLVAPNLAQACAVCMGADDSSIAPAMNGAIFMMLGCIGSVLLSLAAFIIYIARRASRPADEGNEVLNIITKSENHA